MTLHYSPSTMYETVLCRTFNYMAVNPFYRPVIKFYRKFNNRRDVYTLGDVYDMFEQGMDVQKILDEHPFITLKAVLIGRTFHHIHNKQTHTNHALKTLIDENIGLEHTVTGASETLGPSTHVAFEGLVGAKDARLWGYCRARNIQVLVTKDRAVKASRKTKDDMDITRCAILAWKRALKVNGGVVDSHIRSLPVIIHVPHDAKPAQIKNLLRKHRDSIHDIYEERVSPVIILTKGKVKPGIHFWEITGDGFKKQVERLRDMRVEALIHQFEIHGLEEVNYKKIRATLKRAIEHEIATELKPIAGHNERVIYIHSAEKAFVPQEYKYSGSINAIEKIVIRAIQHAEKPTTVGERLKNKKRECNFQLA